jgi:hypothetical protein
MSTHEAVPSSAAKAVWMRKRRKRGKKVVVMCGPFCGDGIDLVDENDGWRVLLGHAEHISHHARALSKILLNEL